MDTHVEGMLVTTVIAVVLELVSTFVVTLFANKLLISDVEVVGDESPLALEVVAAD